MSFQWTVIAGYLYFEVGIVLLMILPIASPRKWSRLFNSRLFVIVRDHATMYFYFLLALLSLCLMDAIRDMRKYSHATDSHTHLASDLKNSVKLFRAQRNFYITGFSIFLSLVIRRLATMFIIEASLTDRLDKLMKDEATNKTKAQTIPHDTSIRQSAGDIAESDKTVIVYQTRIADLQDEVDMWRKKYENACPAGNAGIKEE